MRHVSTNYIVNKLLRPVLWPLAMLYGTGMYLRNKMFDIGLLPSNRVAVPTLVVGNLKVGGTGKTPFVEFLISHFLEEGKSVCVLSRGYGRKTSGFRQANGESTSDDIGDEPYQYHSKFSDRGVRVFVGENRVEAIKAIHSQCPDIEIVILDDAFQHRALKADKYLLLTEESKPFNTDYVMPMGWLREFRLGARRADAICVTKTHSEFKESDAAKLKDRLGRYVNKGTPFYFTQVKYLEAVRVSNFNEGKGIPSQVVLLSGIANADDFISFCRKCYDVKKVFEFPDHHEYTEKEIVDVVRKVRSYSEPVSIVTTEKDKSRLLAFLPSIGDVPLFYIPIQMEFRFSGKEEIGTLLKSWF